MKKKLFLFEFATCEAGFKAETSVDLPDLPKEIIVEGLAMFRSLLSFSKYYEILSNIRKDFRNIFPIKRSSKENFEEILKQVDEALIIAPENNFTLLNLTRKVEEFGVENLGSESRAIEITSDKWKLYNRLKGKVRMPKTSLKELDTEYIVKPRISCGGEGIRIGGEVKDGFIAQELIHGEPLSLSLFVEDYGNDLTLLSINHQLLDNYEYVGAIVPADINRDVLNDMFEQSYRAVERIKGLKGYIGIDFVVRDDPYLIEINARLTTPSILFQFVYGESIADIYINKETRMRLHEIGLYRKLYKNGNKGGDGSKIKSKRNENTCKGEIKKIKKYKLYKGDGDGYVSYKGVSIKIEEVK